MSDNEDIPSEVVLSEIHAPQVCDRCRIKKVACDGSRPACFKCTQARLPCTVSVKLRRNTKPRKFIAPEILIVNNLKAEIARLKSQIEAQAAHNSNNHISTSLSEDSLPSTSDQTAEPPEDHQDESILRHMGRLVPTSNGDRFAGSTTGVHFTRSVEQEYLRKTSSSIGFQDSVFGLHALDQPFGLCFKVVYTSSENRSTLPYHGSIMAESYYLPKLARFFRRWGTLYPIFATKKFSIQVNELLAISPSELSKGNVVVLQQLCLILAIDAWDSPNAVAESPIDNSVFYFHLATQHSSVVLQNADIACLQSHLLASLYFQLTGQQCSLCSSAALAVRTAQSLGLHRHHRRFKFDSGEVELRNRLWYAVRNLDLIISISHGLPITINDEDVDTALPLELDLNHIEAVGSAPNETNITLFLAYIQLNQTIFSCLKQLYTTTQRIGCISKINNLDREIRLWKEHFNSTILARHSSTRKQYSFDDESFTIPYLDLKYRIYLLLIHQPALTFSSDVPQFKQSLKICGNTCREIINIYDRYRSERRLFYMQPNAVKLLFQSALMCLYESWHPDPPILTVSVADIVDTAIELLGTVINDWGPLEGGDMRTRKSIEVINSAISTLNQLIEASQNAQSGSLTATLPNWSQTGTSQLLSGLEELNHLDLIDWDFEAPIVDRSDLISFHLC